MSGQTALIIGCGYVGLALTRALAKKEVRVFATTRSADRISEIEEAGATALIADVTDPASLVPLVASRPHVVFDLVRPQEMDSGGYTSAGTRNVAEAFTNSSLEALVYVSSTSVYGRRAGELTYESTEVAPSSPLGQARVEAEQVYLEAYRRDQLPVRICRVPGIYGPRRTLRQRLESGGYRLMEEVTWVSRIHVDDLVVGLIAAWKNGKPGETYLLCDDEPTTDHEYAALTATLLSLPLPGIADRDQIRQGLGEDAFERKMSSRRCSNTRMREELGVRLTYPSIREGVPASLRAEGAL